MLSHAANTGLHTKVKRNPSSLSSAKAQLSTHKAHTSKSSFNTRPAFTGASRAARRSCGTTYAVATPERINPDAAAPKKPENKPDLIKIPKSIHDIDNGAILGFDANLSPDHPGYLDQDFKDRRKMISDMARDHIAGTKCPYLEYTEPEIETWGKVVSELDALLPKYACKEYLAAYEKCNFQQDRIPQLQDMSKLLNQTTGWTIRPVAGLLHPRDFLNGLAFKTFHSTQYVRHHSKPMYTPEPDVCHELIGHVPMLLNHHYCDLVQQIGFASLGASEKDIWHLTRVYWYTVEFGVVYEEEMVKAFGAGILSSFGELTHMGTGGATVSDLDPYNPLPKMSYKDGFQKHYFALDSFEEGDKLLTEFANTLIEKRANMQHPQEEESK